MEGKQEGEAQHYHFELAAEILPVSEHCPPGTHETQGEDVLHVGRGQEAAEALPFAPLGLLCCDEVMHGAVVSHIARLKCPSIVPKDLTIEDETHPLVVCKLRLEVGPPKVSNGILWSG